jgi:Flp pilus assembly protein TadG
MPRLMPSFRRMRTTLLASEGNAAMEFGILAPMLATIFVPLVDLGMGFYQKMQVENAAQAGVQYAMAHGWNSTAIQNAVTAATSLSSLTASPAPSQSCGCPAGEAVTAATCGSTCAGGQSVGTYVTVSAQVVYRTLVPYPAIGSSLTLSAQSTARIQ